MYYYYAERFKTEISPIKILKHCHNLGTDPPCSYRKKNTASRRSSHVETSPAASCWMRCCSWVGNIDSTGWTTGCFHGVFHKVPPLFKKKKTSHGLVMDLQTLYSMALLGISWDIILWGYHQHELGSSHCGSNGPCIFEGPIAYGQRTKSFKHSVKVWPKFTWLWVFHEIFPILKLTLSSSGKFLPCSDGAMWKCCGNSDCEFELGDVRGCQGNGSAPKI